MLPDTSGAYSHPVQELRVRPFEKLLFANETLAVGTHRLPSSHPEFESYGPASSFLIVFPRNSTLLEYAGGDRFVGSPAVAPLYNRGQEYRRRKVSDEGDHCDWFAIAPEAGRQLVAKFDRAAADSDRPLTFSHVRIEPHEYLQQRSVVDHLASSGSDALFVEETAIDVCTRVLARAYARRVDEPPSKSQQELAHATSQVLSRTFTRNWSLSRIAAAVDSSPFHLARAFKQTAGVTIHQHRIALRMHASLELLRDTNRDLTTIALDLGFGDHSHFTAAFRKRFGLTPSRYRQRASFS